MIIEQDLALATLSTWARIILPIVLTSIVAVFVPLVLSRFLGKGWRRMLVNLLLSLVLVFVLASVSFVVPYLIWDKGARHHLMEEFSIAVRYFSGLGAKSAILWAPLLILTVTSHVGWKGRGTETAY